MAVEKFWPYWPLSQCDHASFTEKPLGIDCLDHRIGQEACAGNRAEVKPQCIKSCHVEFWSS
jgi:hypothetical protein